MDQTTGRSWVWMRPGWPGFTWDDAALQGYVSRFVTDAAWQSGALAFVGRCQCAVRGFVSSGGTDQAWSPRRSHYGPARHHSERDAQLPGTPGHPRRGRDGRLRRLAQPNHGTWHGRRCPLDRRCRASLLRVRPPVRGRQRTYRQGARGKSARSVPRPSQPNPAIEGQSMPSETSTTGHSKVAGIRWTQAIGRLGSHERSSTRLSRADCD